MNVKTIDMTTELVIETCCSCGTPFAIHRPLWAKLKENGKDFFCPNGHPQYYTRKEELEAKVKRLQEQLESAHLVANKKGAELQETKNKLRGTKAALTRTKKRLSGGVCPCCNRQFVQLARHMETKHPNYTEKD